MLMLKETMYDMLDVSFHYDENLRTSIAMSIQAVFILMPDSPKYFARYIDALMKRGADKSTAFDSELDKVIVLSHFLDENQKEDFRQFWDRKTCKRLLTHLFCFPMPPLAAWVWKYTGIFFGLGKRLGPYENDFERQFLLQTGDHYNVSKAINSFQYIFIRIFTI